MKITDLKDIIRKEIEENRNLQCAILKVKKNEIFGELADEINIEYIKGNNVYIRVNNSAIKHYMYTNKNKILEKINLEFDIEDIKINVK